jgi:hypothetical protein
MTHTTTRVVTLVQALRTYNSRDNSEKRPQPWIFLCWIMLSSVEGVPIPWVEGTTVSGRPGYSESSDRRNLTHSKR